VWIDPQFDLLRNFMTIASVTRVQDPGDWNLCGNDGKVLMPTDELTADRIVHLRGKIEVEIEDRLIRFEIQEYELPEISMHHLFRRLQVNRDQWQIISMKGEILTNSGYLLPGKRYFAVKRTETDSVETRNCYNIWKRSGG
jgi:hypothetical protein